MLFLEHDIKPLDADLQVPDSLPHYGVPEVHIDDFDDTLANTTYALNGLLRVCRDLDLGDKINADAIADARQRAWSRGGSYNMLELLGEHLSEQTTEEVRERFRRGDGGYPMSFDDAERYQSRLRQLGYVPHFIMTYGEHADRFPDGGWQRDKIERATNQGWWPTGFAYFMGHSNKGHELARLQNPNTGAFDLIGFDGKGKPAAIYSAHRAVLIDDRKTSLYGSPEECKPVYIRRPEEKPTPKQTQGDLPEAAQVVCSLDEIAVRPGIRAFNDAAQETAPESLDIVAFAPFSLLSSYLEINDKF